MSLFKKPKKNLSLKSARTVDEDAESELASAETAAPANLPKPVEATTVVEKSSSLKVTTVSFAEENEDAANEFQIKKSDRSIRVAQQLKQEYVKSQKKEGKRNVKPSSQQTKKPSATNKSENDNDVILIGDEAAEHEETNNSSEATPVSFTSSLSEMMKSGVLPDANMIHLIKKKRQLMRDTGIATGQATSGDVGVPVRVEPRREEKSALVREDDEADRSDISDQEATDDADGRLKMSVRQRQEDKRQKLRSHFLSAEQGSDEESDQEREWEKQQISKGVSTMTVVDKQQTAALFSGVISEATASATVRMTAPSARKAMTVAKVSATDIKNELSQHLSDLVESNRRHKFERQARADSYDYSQEEIKKAEEQTASLDKQYRFYQELLAYFADYIDCYNTKMPAINGMEERLLTAYRQRTDRLMKRRRQDMVDQSLESAPLKPGQAPFQADEEARSRIADRTNRRSRRRWRRQEQGVRNHYEGWSTDEEEATSDNIKMGSERDAVRKQVAETLCEICDDFVQLDAVISRFKDWRNEIPESYRAAFGGLCLSKLVAPLVRLHILDWNPLEESATSIHDHMWFKTLAGFCRVEAEPTAETGVDELSILPSIVDKVILVKINDLVAKVWDPLSLSQTKRLADLLESLATTFPTLNSNSKQLRDLISSVKKRFAEILDSDVFMPLCTKQALADRASPLSQFFYRQLWTCIKLFVSMSRFSTLISSTALHELMLNGLLNRYIALGLTQLETVTQEVIELYTMIMSAVPVIWFAKMPAGQVTTLDRLKPFATLLFQLVGRFSATSADPQSRAAVQIFASAVSDFFLTIHANDLASRIVSELNIQL